MSNLRTLQFQVEPRAVGIWTHACYDNPPDIDAADNVQNDFDERATNKDGYVAYGLVEPRVVYILIRAKTHGYQEQVIGPIQMPHDELITVTLAPAPLSRLTAHREGFQNPQGQRVVLAGVSAFMHYQRFLDGEDIQPLLKQAQELGANCVRVFGMAHYIPVNAGRRAFKPQDYGDRYFDQIPAFCALCESYGQYVYWSVFPDNEIIGVPDARGFLDRVVDKLKQAVNTLVELTNEQDAHSFNHIDPTQMNRPSGIAACSGSYGDIGMPHPHPWDFCDYHQPRRYEPPTHIKDACVVDHPSYLQGFGILLGEPDRYGTGGNPDANQARLSAGASRETALGEFFHSMQGRESLTYDGETMDRGRVFFKALVGAA